MNCKRLKRSIGWLLLAGMWIGFALLLSGCNGRAKARPELPFAFHFLEPGSTNTVVIPVECQYGIWTTDKGLLYLQGLQPK